ncbi:MAG TPA: sugar-binding protein [Firmicutes bacterium]|nr:sugar-binding protein [Bacillota bacterium]
MKHQYTQVRVHRKGLPCFFLAVLTGIITMIAAMAANAAIAPTKTETGRYGYYQAPQAGETIHIDGLAEESCWEKAAWSPIDQLWLGVQPEPEDFSGRFKVLWDEDHLYILVEIIDDVLFDRYPDPLDNYYKDDCLEIFLDEDHSGGDHTHNFNAFAYHIALDYNIVDIYAKHRRAAPQPVLLNDHAVVKRTARAGEEGTVYTWEVALKVFADTFNPAKENTPVQLFPGKRLGFAVAYCDNDGGYDRESFMGSVFIPGKDKNIAYKDASVLATLELMP